MAFDPVTGAPIPPAAPASAGQVFTQTGNPIADAITGVETSAVAGVEAAHAGTLEDKITQSVAAASGFTGEALAVLNDLGVVNSKLLNEGTSVAALISAFASAFAGIKL